MTEFRDFRGSLIAEGDTVAYFQGGRYDSLNIAEVIELRAKVKIKILESSRAYHEDTTTWTFPERLIVLESAEDRYPCGHTSMKNGCGGCDPGAIDYVILEDGTRRPFDPELDLRDTDK